MLRFIFTILFALFFTFFVLYLFALLPRLSRKRDMLRYRHTMFAHRGYHCLEKGIPENSMAAFRAALNRGYGIEIDLHLTKDGHLVVFHDDTLERMCGRPDVIEHLTYKELKSCRLGDDTVFRRSTVSGGRPGSAADRIKDSGFFPANLRKSLSKAAAIFRSLPDPVL